MVFLPLRRRNILLQNNNYYIPHFLYFLSSATHTLQSKDICSLTDLNCISHLDNQTRSQISCYLQSQESFSQELNQGWLVTDLVLLQNGNNNDSLSNTKFQKAWSCIFTSPFVSIVWCLFNT